MKNTVQAHRKCGTKSRSLQTKTFRTKSAPATEPQNAALGKAGGGLDAGWDADNEACLLLHHLKTDSTLANVAVSTDRLAAIQKTAAARGETLDDWLVRTIDETAAVRSLKAARVSDTEAREVAEWEAELKASLVLPDDAPHHACLCIYDRMSQQVVSKVPLSEEVFCQAVLQRSKQSAIGKDMENFFVAAITEKLRHPNLLQSVLQQRIDFRTLESSIEAAVALLLVLAEKSEDSGLQTLTDQTIAKLNADVSQRRQGATAPVASEVAS